MLSSVYTIRREATEDDTGHARTILWLLQVESKTIRASTVDSTLLLPTRTIQILSVPILWIRTLLLPNGTIERLLVPILWRTHCAFGKSNEYMTFGASTVDSYSDVANSTDSKTAVTNSNDSKTAVTKWEQTRIG
jgi:hypothetical protein